MATASTPLLLSDEDLTRNTILGGNIDKDRYRYKIKTAQKRFIKKDLGKELYDALLSAYVSGNGVLTGRLSELYEDSVKDMLIHKSAELYLFDGAYMVSDNGISKIQSDNSVSIEQKETNLLVIQYRTIYDDYKQDMIKFLNDNKDIYPEWNSHCNCNTRRYTGGWIIDKNKNVNDSWNRNLR